MDPLPPGLFQAGQQGSVKPPGPIIGPQPGLKASTIDSLNGVAVAAALGVGASVSGENSKAYQGFVKFFSGFKVPTPTAEGGVPTPFAVGFILPQPIGALPQRFFQGKPQIPFTGIYFDPLYNVERQLDKIDQRQQRAAGASQRIQFANLLEDLTEDELRLLLLKPDLKRQYLAFLSPRDVDRQLLEELHKRKAKRDLEEGQQRYLEAQAESDVIRRAIIFVLTIDALFAANPPDP